MSGEDTDSRNVLVDQTQDQRIEAVRSGAGRDDHNQHNGIKRLGQMEPIINPVCFIDWLIEFDSLPP